jgi:NAD(P)-dependent dehydrogenase (short-subunit alcohol dehydrogenase family)
MSEFVGKVVVVTGGGSGIGQGTALLFAREGSNIAVIDWNDSTALETLKLIEQAGGQGLFVKADVSNSSEVQQAVEVIVDRFGKIDVLFINAAIQINKPLTETADADWDQTLAVNLRGAFLCCKHIVPVMQKQKGGSIVICSSGHAFFTYPNYAAYATTKGGLIAFMRAAALDCAPYGIRVNCVVPGATDTPLLRYHLRNRPEDEPRLLEKIPLHRFATATDIGKAVRFLSSSDAAYITGTWLVVDGGLLAQG